MQIAGSMESGTDSDERASASTYIYNNRWHLENHPGWPGAKLHVQTECSGLTAGRTSEVYWDYANSAGTSKVLAPYSATTACFITHIGQSYVFNDGGIFSTAASSLRITHDATNWYLTGTGFGAGSARCITVNARAAEVQAVGPTSIELTNQSGHQCYLTGVKGKFRTDYQHGVQIFYSPTTTRRDFDVDPGFTGWATCIN